VAGNTFDGDSATADTAGVKEPELTMIPLARSRGHWAHFPERDCREGEHRSSDRYDVIRVQFSRSLTNLPDKSHAIRGRSRRMFDGGEVTTLSLPKSKIASHFLADAPQPTGRYTA
jgi:hypothetical protein